MFTRRLGFVRIRIEIDLSKCVCVIIYLKSFVKFCLDKATDITLIFQKSLKRLHLDIGSTTKNPLKIILRF